MSNLRYQSAHQKAKEAATILDGEGGLRSRIRSIDRFFFTLPPDMIPEDTGVESSYHAMQGLLGFDPLDGEGSINATIEGANDQLLANISQAVKDFAATLSAFLEADE